MLDWGDAIKLSIPAVVPIIGWIVQSRLALAAQRNNFRLQVRDRARLEIVKALREYQHWLQSAGAAVRDIRANLEWAAKGSTVPWDDKLKALSEQLSSHRQANEWSLRLEEFEIVFPETRDVRITLVLRSQVILRNLFRTSELFWGEHFSFGSNIDSRLALADAAVMMLAPLEDQIAFCEDLIVHLQNISLGEIMDRKVPLRIPGDPNVKRLEWNERTGQLELQRTREYDTSQMDEFRRPTIADGARNEPER